MFNEENSELIKQAEEGNIPALLKLGNLCYEKFYNWLYFDDSVGMDEYPSEDEAKEFLRKAVLYFEEAMNQGEAEGMKRLADVYCDLYTAWFDNVPVVDSVVKDREAATKLYERAINYYESILEKGNDKAHFDLAYLYSISLIDLDIINCFEHYFKYVNKYDDRDIFITTFDVFWYQNIDEKTMVKSFYFDTYKPYIDCFEIIINRQNDDDYKYRDSFKNRLLYGNSEEELLIANYLEEKINNKDRWVKVSYAIGEWYLKRDPRNVANAIEWLKLGCNNNCMKSAEILGKYYCGLYNSEEINDMEAEKYLELAVSLGNNDAAIFLASKYVSKNDISYKDKIISLFLEAASKDQEVYYFLAKYYLSINEYMEALKYFEMGKKDDFSECNFEIASLYKEGKGCEQDVDEAIDIFKTIIKYDNESDEYDDFVALRIIISDEEKAKELFGNAYAELGEIYYDEKYGHKNNKRANKYLSYGIKKNNAKAYHLLGNLILDGYYEAGTVEEGKEYLKIARSLGYISSSINNKKENNNKSLEAQIIFYQKQLEEKDELIKKQQNQIEKITDVLIDKVSETNEIVKRIDNKVDTLLDEVSIIKKENNESLNKIITNQEAYEEKINEIENKIIEKISSNVDLSRSPKYIDEYISLFKEENWNKLKEESKRYLLTAKVLFKTLSTAGNAELDYSGVCLMICKTVETELKERFYFEFLKYLKDRYDDDYSKYHSHLVNSYFDRTNNIKKYKLKPESKICLGDIIFILCPRYIEKKFVGDYLNSKEQIRLFLNNYIFKNKVDDQYIENLCKNIQKIKDDYRNPSCHLSPVKFITAAECFDYVIDTTKVLITFLDECRS